MPSSVRVTTLCCISLDLRCRPENDSKLGASVLSSRDEISAYFAAVGVVPKLLEEDFEADEVGRELSGLKDSVEPGLGVGGFPNDRLCRLCVRL